MADIERALAALLGPVLRQLVAEEVQKAVKAATADDEIPHTRSGLPARVACAACAAGEVQGARKVGKRWLASRSAWDAYLDRQATRRAGDVANDADDNTADLMAYVRGAAQR